MDERFCKVGDVELCYEPFGDPDRPAVLLVMGLGTQMIGWHADFCAQLADRGFHVIRYDNRDVGPLDAPERPARAEAARDHDPPDPPARLPARATWPTTASACSSELGIERAHIVGASMGGMIAQTMAAQHPDRVLSLVSIMSSTGSRWSGQPAPRILPVLLQKPAASKEDYQERIVKLFKLVGSPGVPARRRRAARARRRQLGPRHRPGRLRAPARRDHRERPSRRRT